MPQHGGHLIKKDTIAARKAPAAFLTIAPDAPLKLCTEKALSTSIFTFSAHHQEYATSVLLFLTTVLAGLPACINSKAASLPQVTASRKRHCDWRFSSLLASLALRGGPRRKYEWRYTRYELYQDIATSQKLSEGMCLKN